MGADLAGTRSGVNFLTGHLGFPIPSPAILEKIGLRFRKAVTEFARDNDIEVIRFAKGDRKLDVMRPYLDRLAVEGRTGVAAIGVAQEFQRVFSGTTHHGAVALTDRRSGRVGGCAVISRLCCRGRALPGSVSHVAARSRFLQTRTSMTCPN